MPITELTVEDQIVTDIVAQWNAAAPTGMPSGVNIYDFRRTGDVENPCVIIGHQGVTRETAKGMFGTGRVNLVALVRTSIGGDADQSSVETHRLIVLAVDEGLRALEGTQFQLTTCHAMLRENVQKNLEDRRQLTALSYTAVATRMEEVP